MSYVPVYIMDDLNKSAVNKLSPDVANTKLIYSGYTGKRLESLPTYNTLADDPKNINLFYHGAIYFPDKDYIEAYGPIKKWTRYR